MILTFSPMTRRFFHTLNVASTEPSKNLRFRKCWKLLWATLFKWFSDSISCLAYCWRAGNLNWSIRIQQAGKILVSWPHVEIRQLLSLEMALNIYEKGFTISRTKLVGKKWKIWTILCFQASVLAPKMGHRRSAWQLPRSSSSIAR